MKFIRKLKTVLYLFCTSAVDVDEVRETKTLLVHRLDERMTVTVRIILNIMNEISKKQNYMHMVTSIKKSSTNCREKNT